MQKTIFKSIAGGIFLGAFLFFTGPLLVIVLLLKFIFTPFGMGRFGRYGMMGGHRFAFADKIRAMSEEDYASLKNKFERNVQIYCNQSK